MKYKLLLVVLLPLYTYAQKFTISGTIQDGTNGESLIGANIYIPTLEVGAVTNAYGFYSLTAEARDSITILYSYLGFEAQLKKVYFNQDYQLNIAMQSSGLQLDEVVVSSQRNNDNVQRAQMGVIDVPVKLIQELPAILGETDVLKVIQLLPGVQGGQEGTTGFYVRGGNADQNLVQLDEAVVYNPNHLFGLVSTFNSRALKNVNLIKGGFPANYGGRLSSILDISMKEGNNQKFEGYGGIGLISSHLTLEGPLKKDKTSYIISGRRTYLDLLLKPFKKLNQTAYKFYDINAKINHKFSEKDRLFLSFFQGRDIADYKDGAGLEYGLRFGNQTATLRWNHIFGKKLFLNTSFIYNNYFQNYFSLQSGNYRQFYSGLIDYTGKLEFQYYPNPKHRIKFGALISDHQFTSTGKAAKVPKSQDVTSIDVNKISPRNTDETAFYINDEWSLSNVLAINVGLRVPTYKTETETYFRVEPRASVKVLLDGDASLKASYTVMNQFLHLVGGSTASLPVDLWVPSSKITKPQRSEQYALGYFRNFKNNEIETSVEAYYKTMENQILFGQGTQLLEQSNFDDILVFGKGWSYGIEFFVKKNFGRLNGWVSYTLSKTEQQFDDINFGKKFPFKYDRRHNLSVTGSYKLSDKWTLSSSFIFYSGAAYTLPAGRFTIAEGGSLYSGNYFDYTEYNGYRLKPYHRLDIAATRYKKAKIFGKEYDSELVLSLYNVYSRLNPYFVFTDINIVTNKPIAKQVSLLPIIPGFSYNFKF